MYVKNLQEFLESLQVKKEMPLVMQKFMLRKMDT